MMSQDDDRRVYRDSERVFFNHLESTLEAGVSEITLEGQRFKVKRGRGEDWIPYFILEPIEPSRK